jgi:nitronate monooxygenase
VCRKVDFIITSQAHLKKLLRLPQSGIKVFCDVTDFLRQKVESLGADALIAVNNLAGGHRGNLALKH